jgi:OPA family glycerol-3-phosphate transporter-like MFS transporter
MNHDDLPSTGQRPLYPPGFRARRGINWASLGLLYTSYYMCRYNLSIANKAIATEYGFNKTQMGWIITTNLFAYACGQIINGLMTDKMGGKKAMLIGAAGTIVMNSLFGAASFMGLLGLFIAIWGLNGYVQAFGAPGMVKINTAWFAHRERGRFAGIFGFMINLGRFFIFRLGPALLAGFVLLGLIAIPPLHWRWLFWVPSFICGIAAIVMALLVKETPEEAGYQHDEAQGKWSASASATQVSAFSSTDARVLSYQAPVEAETRATSREVFLAIVTNPAIWITACAYACTGAVRQAVDQWFPRYMQDVHHLSLDSSKFQWLALLIPFVASVGSLSSGYISDLMFQSRRAPVAAAIYVLETIIILAAAQFHSANAAVTFFVLISLTANSTHSLLGTAAAMDIGGRKMAGFASGVIDSFQYFGGSLAGIALGSMIDHVGWGSYFYFMAPFGIIGGVLMFFAGDTITRKARQQPLPVAPAATDPSEQTR